MKSKAKCWLLACTVVFGITIQPSPWQNLHKVEDKDMKNTFELFHMSFICHNSKSSNLCTTYLQHWLMPVPKSKTNNKKFLIGYHCIDVNHNKHPTIYNGIKKPVIDFPYWLPFHFSINIPISSSPLQNMQI